MAESSFQADLSEDPIAELGQLTGRNGLHQKRQSADYHFREGSTSNESLELPRVRLGGITVVMTMISFLLASSAGFFGYRAIFESNSTSKVSAVKASKEPNKIALAPGTSQVQFGDKQAAVPTGSIEDAKTHEESWTPASHVV